MKCWWHCLPHTRPWLHRTSYECMTTLKNRKQHKYKGKYINTNTKQRQDKSTIIKPKTSIQRIHNWRQKQGRLPQVFICLIIWTLHASDAISLWLSSAVRCSLHLKYQLLKMVRAEAAEEADWLIGWQVWKWLRASNIRASTIPHRTWEDEQSRASTNHPSQNKGRWAEQRPTE